jgi:hypothetical protein
MPAFANYLVGADQHRADQRVRLDEAPAALG